MRTRWMCSLAVSALVLLPDASASAQVAEMQVGTRVRVRAPSAVAGRLSGVVVARSADSVSISRPDALPLAVPISALTSLEISRGRSRSRGAGRGAIWGGGIMAVLGAIPFGDRPCRDEQAGPGCEQISVGESVVFSALGGAIIGAAIGAAVGSEHWVRAALPGRVAITTVPSAFGRQIGARFSLSLP